MPWCPDCEAYRAPSAVAGDGRCRSCGTRVEAGGLRTATAEGDGVLPPVPWHLKLLVAALVVYLGARGWQGIEWVMDKL